MSGTAAPRRQTLPALIFAVCAAVYVGTLGPRVVGPSDNNHFVHLANSYLHGQLSVVGNTPPGDNDWANYRGRWYVSFPPLPALIILPAVAIWGTAVWDSLFWAILAGLGPSMLFVLLRSLSEAGFARRSTQENLILTALFAFGSVYYYTSVQGTVWFAAHVVATPLIALCLRYSLGARHPLLAGTALAACFMARPTSLLLGLFFAAEALRSHRADSPAQADGREPHLGLWRWLGGVRSALAEDGPGPYLGLWRWLGGVHWPAAARGAALFCLPLLLVGGLAMWLNQTRFDDPFEFGHSHLKIRWRGRIDTWGLFNYHYLAKNLAVYFTSLPWLSSEAPYLKIGRHGLALWVTTPALLLVLWPRRISPTLVGLMLAAGAVALLDLCYQNTGWVQFGYRFSLDYLVALFALLAMGGRRFGPLFHGLMVWAVAINLFGAITFDRSAAFYDKDRSQRVIFQPD